MAYALALHLRSVRHCRDEGIPYRISFVPDPVAWTEAPERIRILGRQRDRWQRGLGGSATPSGASAGSRDSLAARKAGA